MSIQEFLDESKLLTDEDSISLYPGCKLLGGVASSDAAMLAGLRKQFCNDRLFEHDLGKPVSATQLEDNKYVLLKEMNELVGSQIRKMCEPLLLRIINSFCTAASDVSDKQTAGRIRRVETPFFSVVIYAFATSNEHDVDEVIHLGWARWATDVC